MLLHATAIAINDVGILITGPSGAGKSSLAIELMTRGAQLISDDQTMLTADGGALVAQAPASIAGCIEMFGVGVIQLAQPQAARAAVAFEVRLMDRTPDRLPEPKHVRYMGIELPLFEMQQHHAYNGASLYLLAKLFQQNGRITLADVAKQAS